jgi:hypothetical protein
VIDLSKTPFPLWLSVLDFAKCGRDAIISILFEAKKSYKYSIT